MPKYGRNGATVQCRHALIPNSRPDVKSLQFRNRPSRKEARGFPLLRSLGRKQHSLWRPAAFTGHLPRMQHRCALQAVPFRSVWGGFAREMQGRLLRYLEALAHQPPTECAFAETAIIVQPPILVTDLILQEWIMLPPYLENIMPLAKAHPTGRHPATRRASADSFEIQLRRRQRDYPGRRRGRPPP